MGTCWHTFSMTVSHCWVILVHIWTFCYKETFYNAPQISLTAGTDLSAGPAHVGGGGWTSSTASSSSTGVSPSTGRAWCQRLVGDRADLLGLHRVLTRPQLTHRLGHIEALLPILCCVGGFLNMCTIVFIKSFIDTHHHGRDLDCLHTADRSLVGDFFTPTVGNLGNLVHLRLLDVAFPDLGANLRLLGAALQPLIGPAKKWKIMEREETTNCSVYT